MNRKDIQGEREGRSGRLDRLHEERASCDRHPWIEQDPDPSKVWRDLFQQLEPFSAHRRFDIGEAGGVAARPSQACGELLAERIGRRDENDRDRAGLGKQGSDRNRAPGEEHVRLQGHQLLAGSGEAVLVTGRETIIDAEVRPVGPAEALHGFEERRSLGSPLRIVFAGGHKNAEPAELARVLRARRSGHAAAAPITAMTSRRLNRSPRVSANAMRSRGRRHRSSSLCPAFSTAGVKHPPPAVQSKAANAKHSATMTRDQNNSRCAGVMPHDNMKNARRVSRRAWVA